MARGKGNIPARCYNATGAAVLGIGNASEHGALLLDRAWPKSFASENSKPPSQMRHVGNITRVVCCPISSTALSERHFQAEMTRDYRMTSSDYTLWLVISTS